MKYALAIKLIGYAKTYQTYHVHNANDKYEYDRVGIPIRTSITDEETWSDRIKLNRAYSKLKKFLIQAKGQVQIIRLTSSTTPPKGRGLP